MKDTIKSRLLQPSRIERIFEKLIEFLPRKQIFCTLEQNDKIEQICNSPGDYRSMGNGALFNLTFVKQPKRGWHYLEAALSRGNGDRIAGFIVKKAAEEIFIKVSSNLRGSIREVIYLPSDILAVYWLPCNAPGYFSQTPLLLHRISWLESALRRVYRIIYDAYRWDGVLKAIQLSIFSLINLDVTYRKNVDLRVSRFSGFEYSSFLIRSDKRDRKEGAIARANIERESGIPKFVIAIRFSGDNFMLLKTTICSIVAQDYANFEITIIDYCGAKKTIDEYVRLLAPNLCINILFSAGKDDELSVYNSVIFGTSADLFFKLNAGDLISPSALSVFAFAFIANPKVNLIYSDHDLVDGRGRRCFPAFKPDWNKELFLSFNYIGYSCVFHVDSVKRVGGYDQMLNYWGDYDLILRIMIGGANSALALHIPSALFHFFEQSPQQGSEWLCYGMASWETHDERRKILSRIFVDKGIQVEDSSFPDVFRIRYPLPRKLPLVSIIIPTKDRVDLLRKCVESILSRTIYSNFEILIVDNASIEYISHDYFKDVQRDPRVSVIQYKDSFNYSAINNFAVSNSRGDFVALVNNDVEVINEQWLGELVSHASRPDIGAVGAKLLYGDNTVQHAGVVIGIGGIAGHAHRFINDNECGYGFRAVATQDISAVTAACLVVRKSLYIDSGGLNSVDLKIAYNDVDFCMKLKELGFRNIYTPYAKLFHHESVSRGRDDTPEKARRFESESSYMKKHWGKKLRCDPSYNRNLTHSFENFCYNQFI